MKVIKFHELEDGAKFMIAQTWAYGSRSVFIKTMEDGKHHNTVWLHDSNKAFFVDHNTLVIPVH